MPRVCQEKIERKGKEVNPTPTPSPAGEARQTGAAQPLEDPWGAWSRVFEKLSTESSVELCYISQIYWHTENFLPGPPWGLWGFRFGWRLAHTGESPSVLLMEAPIVTFQPSTIRAADLTQTVPGMGPERGGGTASSSSCRVCGGMRAGLCARKMPHPKNPLEPEKLFQ